MRTLALIALTAAFVAPTAALATPDYEIIPTGEIGNEYYWSMGINNSGLVGAYESANVGYTSYTWDGASTTFLPNVRHISAVSNTGDIALSDTILGHYDASVYNGSAVSSVGAYTTCGANRNWSAATDRSDTGTTVGGLEVGCSGQTQGFRRTSSGLAILSVYPGKFHSQVNAISDNGAQVVGFSWDAAGLSYRAVGWNTWGTIYGLTHSIGGLPSGFGGVSQSRAYGVNNSGRAVGSVRNASNTTVAVVWDTPNTAFALPLPSGAQFCEATAINNADEVVGRCHISGLGYTGFVWDSAQGLRLLDDVTALPSQFTGTRFVGGINDLGQIVATVGLASGSGNEVVMINPTDIPSGSCVLDDDCVPHIAQNQCQALGGDFWWTNICVDEVDPGPIQLHFPLGL